MHGTASVAPPRIRPGEAKNDLENGAASVALNKPGKGENAWYSQPGTAPLQIRPCEA
jgi:hypothetical protein